MCNKNDVEVAVALVDLVGDQADNPGYDEGRGVVMAEPSYYRELAECITIVVKANPEKAPDLLADLLPMIERSPSVRPTR